jgi:mannose-6-phosphate isomerase-like protein (cupin superfamily)
MEPSLKHEERPWGSFTEFATNEPVTVKIITVQTGQAFSLQTHQNRDEFWHIISGKGLITINEQTTPLTVGTNYTIPRGARHRVEATTEPVVFLEVARGTFDEKDIVRLDDRYGRT